jgi:hypothetical protein
MTRWALHAISAGVVLLSLLVECQQKSEQDSPLVKAVRDYNVAIIQAYSDANLNYMQPFASKEEINKLFPVMQSLTESNSRMVSIQKQFKVTEEKQTGEESGYVATNERWVYWWEDMRTGAVTKPKSEVNYHLTYHLQKEGTRWKVDRIQLRE